MTKTTKLKLHRETVQCLTVPTSVDAAASAPIRCITDGHFTCAC